MSHAKPTDRVADGSGTMVGAAPALLAALEAARRFADSTIPILITGETGTGKELLARYVHRLSGRSTFVDVDCGALPEDLIESLLFGHRRGAFTGAVEHSEGIIGQADGGTLLLDELASLPLRGQAKLLRVLENGEVRRLGSGKPRKVDFRLVSTAQCELGSAVERGDFRMDLVQRIAGAVIRLPTLAERHDDVVLLARHFAAEAGAELDERAEQMLAARSWPGNVRELRWTVLRAVQLGRDAFVTPDALQHAIDIGPGPLLVWDGRRVSTARERLVATCRTYAGDPHRIASALGISRSTLYRWLRDAGLELRTFRRALAAS